jgi:hypothetical protein
MHQGGARYIVAQADPEAAAGNSLDALTAVWLADAIGRRGAPAHLYRAAPDDELHRVGIRGLGETRADGGQHGRRTGAFQEVAPG